MSQLLSPDSPCRETQRETMLPEAEESAAAEPASSSAEEPPYSLRNELRFFFSQGVPLCLSAILEWGAPPLITMFFAGSTPDSAHLQSALGYGRVYFNVSMLMVMLGLSAYLWNVLPGCIGASRRDRIPHYFRRAVVLAALSCLPSCALQFVSAPVLRCVGVEPSIAAAVGTYTRVMAGGALLLLLDIQIEAVFVSCGYARSASLNSLLTGLGLDVLCSYAFIYRWRWGVLGAAVAWSTVRASRIVVWCGLAWWFGLLPLFLPRGKQHAPLFSRREVCEFARLTLPQIASNFSGWLIFELQLVALTNVRGVSTAQVAAGAIWVQCEQALSAAQQGWIQVVSVRTMTLLGKRDPGAKKAFFLLIGIASVLVAAYNVALLAASGAVTHAVSNDEAVRDAFGAILWVLLPHMQTRILSICSMCLFVPLGKPLLSIGATFFCFYAVASPVVGALALTDLATSSVPRKLAFCVGATTIAQAPLALFGLTYCLLMDWSSAGRVINSRANTDRCGSGPRSSGPRSSGPRSSGGPGGSPYSAPLVAITPPCTASLTVPGEPQLVVPPPPHETAHAAQQEAC